MTNVLSRALILASATATATALLTLTAVPSLAQRPNATVIQGAQFS